ncbi:MAG: DUF3299 domain-containing protein [Pirellulaceae bacterium]|nr:DUF3299 domain-containing protein [Pirellulaceae bacterium]
MNVQATGTAALNFALAARPALAVLASLLIGAAVLFLAQPLLAQSPGKPQDVTFDNLKFEMEKGADFERSMLTGEIEQLVGKKIRIRGYILPSFQQTGITQFVLVRDNMECCFGPGAALYDCVVVDMESGKSTSFTVRPVAVTGQFTVKPFKGPNGKHLAIYHLEGHEVK